MNSVDNSFFGFAFLLAEWKEDSSWWEQTKNLPKEIFDVFVACSFSVSLDFGGVGSELGFIA